MHLLKKNQIVTVDKQCNYLITGRTYYMGQDYYPAKQLDQNDQPISGADVFLYEGRDFFDFDEVWDEEDDEDDESDIHLKVLCNRELEELLWVIFYEQEMEEWV